MWDGGSLRISSGRKSNPTCRRERDRGPEGALQTTIGNHLKESSGYCGQEPHGVSFLGVMVVRRRCGDDCGTGPQTARCWSCGGRRWIVERTNAWLQTFRRLVVRYERPAEIYEGLVHLPARSLRCGGF